MYAAAGGASLAGRKARQHGRQPAPGSPRPPTPPPAPCGVRAYSCQHWEARVLSPRAAAAPCDLVECAAGRAAWQEAAALAVGAGAAGAGGAARRCSVLGDHPTARRDQRSKWGRNNRVRDASYGSSSESECEAEGADGEPWGVARLLYAGLAILALGLLVYFVGTGDKGFKTPALRLVGPSLICLGLGCCLLRIAFCIFAKPCCKRRTMYKETRRLSPYYGESLPLAHNGSGAGRRGGPAQCSPARRLDASSCDVSSLSSGEEDERLRRYRITPHEERGQTSSHSTLHQGSVHRSASPAPINAHSATQSVPQTVPQVVQSSAPQSVVPSPQSPGLVPVPIPNVPSPAAHVPTNVLHTNVICASASAVPCTSAIPGPSTSHSARWSAITSAVASTSDSALRSASALPGPSVVPSTSAVSSTNTLVPSSLHHVGQRRPPPRNVSFAHGGDDELVLSPAQLRS